MNGGSLLSGNINPDSKVPFVHSVDPRIKPASSINMESGDYFGQSAPQLPQKFDRAGGSIKTIVQTAANIVTETAGLVTGGSGDTSTANRGNGIDNLEPWPSLLNADATCAEWCTCMRNEMLYATTWSIPYKVETFNGMSYYRIRMIKDHGNDLWVRFNPDATHGKWEWTNEIDKDHEGQTPEGQEVDYYSLDENEAFEDGGVPVRLQFIMRLMPYCKWFVWLIVFALIS
jgi:hypothetical protein|tara:strand:+ start:524 stop:1213 length:690 start_codon:yes stop_codon:yes gene_type:complete